MVSCLMSDSHCAIKTDLNSLLEVLSKDDPLDVDGRNVDVFRRDFADLASTLLNFVLSGTDKGGWKSTNLTSVRTSA
jgi:hypothetical protein